jgi:hypothetical protein
MTKTGVNLLFLIACAVAAFYTKNETWRGAFLGGVFTSLIVIIESGMENRKHLALLFLSKIRYRNKLIRFSISYLYKIKVDDKYLLVKGKRIQNQFQPVGGVYKRHSESKAELNAMGVLDDNSMPIDGESRGDLRIRLPGKKAVALIKWFNAEKGREVSPFREFCEELILTDILDKTKFHYIDYSFVGRIEKGIRFSNHFQCYEYLIADIVELRPTGEQLIELRKLITVQSQDFIWVNENTIRRRGYHLEAGVDVTISETSEWIL